MPETTTKRPCEDCHGRGTLRTRGGAEVTCGLCVGCGNRYWPIDPAPEPTPAPRPQCEAHQDARGRCTLPATWRTDGLGYGLLFKFCDDHRNESIDFSRSLGGSGGDWVRLPDALGVCLACSGPCEPGTSLCPCAEPVDA